jgi:hypothetical protein
MNLPTLLRLGQIWIVVGELSSLPTAERNMKSNVRTVFWIEAGLAFLCGILALLTLFTGDWIEALTGFDPDQHDGSSEWLNVIALAVVCAVVFDRRAGGTAPFNIIDGRSPLSDGPILRQRVKGRFAMVPAGV